MYRCAHPTSTSGIRSIRVMPLPDLNRLSQQAVSTCRVARGEPLPSVVPGWFVSAPPQKCPELRANGESHPKLASNAGATSVCAHAGARCRGECGIYRKNSKRRRQRGRTKRTRIQPSRNQSSSLLYLLGLSLACRRELSVTAASWSGLKCARHPGLSCDLFLIMQTVTRSMSGIS